MLVIDREGRVGDNWRHRYRGLKLHNKTPVNHLRYLPFPVTFPDYIPKDQIANFLESYVDLMEVDFWTQTSFEGARYDDSTQRWTADLKRADGNRVLRPKHIVLATSVSGTPNIPEIDGIENFAGKVLHSSQFTAGREWAGRSVVVFGTGTSAHDICQELQAFGAEVAMVQRSPTMVVNVETAQLYDRTYLGEGPPIEVRDILNSGVPLPVMKMAHKLITDEVKKLDAPLLARLEAAGFRLEFGEGGTGWPLKFRTRGGGYYFNVGCSELIADGKIRLIQSADIEGDRAARAAAQGRLDGSMRTCSCWRRATRARITCCKRCSAPRSPAASGASGDLTRRHPSFATCGGAPASRACGSPPAPFRRPASTAASSRCRSMRSRRGGWRSGWSEFLRRRRAAAPNVREDRETPLEEAGCRVN